MRYLVVVLTIAATFVVASGERRAHADKAVLAGIGTPSPGDARKAIAVGPSGQIYEPDGKGAWVRKKAGGTGDEIVRATSAAGTVVADAKGSAIFRLEDNGWTSIRVVQKGKTILGAGTRLLAAAGKSVFALDNKSSTPTKIADAPLPIVAVAGTVGGSIVVATAKGLFGLQGTTFKPIKNAPRTGSLLSDRFLLVGTGIFDLKTQKTLAWPAGLKITDTALVGGDTLLAVGVRGGKFELVIVKATGAGAKMAGGAKAGGAKAGGAKAGGAKASGADTESIPLPNASPVVGLVGDKTGRVVVATRDGHIAIRDGGSWTVSEVSEDLPEPKPGPAPAESP